MSKYDIDLIKDLKKNKFAIYAGWSPGMLEMAVKLGVLEFECRNVTPGLGWFRITAITHAFKGDFVYRLRPDYEEKADIVECVVDKGASEAYSGLLVYVNLARNSLETLLCRAVNDPDFAGFKYKDERMKELNWHDVYPVPRIYLGPAGDIRTSFVFIDIALYEVLTPVAVLFRSTK